MIKYSLKCAEKHEFEAWFASLSAYEEQAGTEQICCPICSTTQVKKALMAPNIVSRSGHESMAKPAGNEAPHREALQLMRKLKKFVEQNSEYVGPRFAKEALKIHHEETEARSIYGEASESEADLLRDEGVEFYPLPLLPEDHN